MYKIQNIIIYIYKKKEAISSYILLYYNTSTLVSRYCTLSMVSLGKKCAVCCGFFWTLFLFLLPLIFGQK